MTMCTGRVGYSSTPLLLLAAKTRVRERAAAITAIDLLDLLAPAMWRRAGGRRRRLFFLVKFRIGANAGARAVTDAADGGIAWSERRRATGSSI